MNTKKLEFAVFCIENISEYLGLKGDETEMGNIPIREALDFFYKSQIYQEMRDGISDMHCRSEKYLAEELILEKNSAQ